MLAAAVGLGSGPALAAYPDRNIQMVVPFLAGGGADVTARVLQRAMEKYLPPNVRIVIVNRPGAAGEIGIAAVANAQPDGYTLGLITTPNITAIPIERTAQYALDKLDFIANIVDDPGTLSVHADSPIKTIPELIEASKKTPGGLTVGTAGVGSAGHIALTLFMSKSEFKGRNVPYSGSAGVRTALLGKDIQVGFANLGEALTYARGQPWRILGVMSAKRFPLGKDYPTFAEAGYPVEGGSLRLIFAPKGMPAEASRYLDGIIEKAVMDPDFIGAAKTADLTIRYMKRPEITQYLQSMDKSLRELWAKTPWQ